MTAPKRIQMSRQKPCHADVLLELANPGPLCPECVQGKCRNCIEQTLNDEDQWVPCACPNHGGTR